MKVWMCVTEEEARECFEAVDVCYNEGFGPAGEILKKLAVFFPDLADGYNHLLEHSK